ncbi:MAG: urea carboxylase-associated family protein, partial [Hyphomicrobiales bacterium]
ATWAFLPPKMSEFMSMEHTRLHATKSRPQLGTLFYTNTHAPILELTADSSPGVHDWYLAACNKQRFEMLGHSGEHASCENNLLSVLTEIGHPVSFVPCPLNLFENVSFLLGDPMEIKEPVAMPGDYVCLKALVDCLVVLSACPQDIALTNGPDHIPRSVGVEVTT